jgi:hypothetical protein
MDKLLNKLVVSILLVAFVVSARSTVASAQVPHSLSYQAVISNAEGEPVVGKVGIKISIIQGSETGELVYSERHTPTTDGHGLVSLRIGEGEPVYKGKFDTINWSKGPYFSRVDIAPGGGFSYNLTTINQLMSVPYALHALSADHVVNGFNEADPIFSASAAKNITAEDTLRWNALSQINKHHIGDFYQGGIIFYIEPGGKNGLIASLTDISEDVEWSGNSNLTGAASSYDGLANTSLIVSILGAGNYAAQNCSGYSIEGFDDWYLPSKDELNLLFKAKYIINKALTGNASAQALTKDTYWTSTERNADEAYLIEFGRTKIVAKTTPAGVRAIRAF